MQFSRTQTSDTSEARQHATQSSEGGVAFAFVGSVVPDEPRFRNAAFSPSGQMYQQGLLLGLKHAGMPPSLILSGTPMPAYSYPHGQQIWVSGEEVFLAEKMPITLLSFLNITPFKQINVGLSTVLKLLKWGWHTRRARFRVVYTYNLTVPPGLFTLFAARCIRAKAVVSLCDINVPGQTVPSGWLWRLDYWLQRKLIPHFDGHVVISDAIARQYLPGKPYLFLEGGIRNQVLAETEDAFAATKSPGTPFVITSAGSLNKANGFLILLKAFSLLQGDQYRLCIAGAGPLELPVREAAANDSRIEYLGLVSFSEVLQLYGRSDVLINMRLTKDLQTEYFFPGKMMEYLASGVPVISTLTGHVKEEFGSFCYLLQEETAEGLAGVIRYVAGQDAQQRKKIGQMARSYMATHKTWQAQSQKVAQYIREIVLGIKSEP